MHDLKDVVSMLMQSGKGILAADESTHSADEKRLAAFGITTGPDMRHAFREVLLGAPGIGEYLSGVILFEETLSQKYRKGTVSATDDVLFPEVLLKEGVLPGIKVDQGLEPMESSPKETITKGLLGLPERLASYKAQGARFTKWRAELKIDGDRLPSKHALLENARRLAGYACEVERMGMVPMLEPEILMQGNHSRLRAKEVLADTLSILFHEVSSQCADLSCVILKTSMVVSGSEHPHEDTPQEVAEDTLEVLMNHVPKEVGGIVFLSGGQTPDQATENLRAIHTLARERNAPWPLTFSFARALQEELLSTWQGKEENVDAARAVFLDRLAQVGNAIM